MISQSNPKIIPYAQLTWPEIAALPRNTPLVIPLGEGYNLHALAEALGSPDEFAFLPAIPFGWNGSSLPVAEAVLSGMLRNLVDSLRDDGFSRVYCLAPQNIPLGLGECELHLALPGRLTPEAPQPPEEARQKVILIPIGHIEQHAYHLPMNTDTTIIQAVAQGAAQLAPDRCSTLLVMPYGVSTHRPAFAGTLNCGGRPFEDFWLNVVDTLVKRGFTRIYLLSGHGGNTSFLNNVVKYAGERYYQAFIATAFLYLSGPRGVAALEAHRQSAIGGMGHACELETSLILHLEPQFVNMDRVVDETDFIATPSYYMDWVEGGALVANPPWEDDTRTGAYGAGSLGTAEKGRLWLEAAIAEKLEHVEEIHIQYQRRIAQRRSSSVG